MTGAQFTVYIFQASIILIGLYFVMKEAIKNATKPALRLLRKNDKAAVSYPSEILKELVGKQCTLFLDDDFDIHSTEDTLTGTVLSVDEQWIKINYINEKKESVIKLIRIEFVLSAELSSGNQ